MNLQEMPEYKLPQPFRNHLGFAAIVSYWIITVHACKLFTAKMRSSVLAKLEIVR